MRLPKSNGKRSWAVIRPALSIRKSQYSRLAGTIVKLFVKKYRPKRVNRIIFPAKPNGSMPAARELFPLSILAKPWQQTLLTTTVARFMPTKPRETIDGNPPKSAYFRRITLGYTTCTAMFGSGAKTNGMTAMKIRFSLRVKPGKTQTQKRKQVM